MLYTPGVTRFTGFNCTFATPPVIMFPVQLTESTRLNADGPVILYTTLAEVRTSFPLFTISSAGVNEPEHCFGKGLVTDLAIASTCASVNVEILISSIHKFCPYPFFATKATCTLLAPAGKKGLISIFSRNQSG